MIIDWRRSDLLVLDDVFDDAELSVFAALADSAEFEDQALGQGLAQPRSRQRAVVDSLEVANMLWWHLAEHVSPLSRWFETQSESSKPSPEIEDWVPSECNERTRLYRYQLGADFRPHEDEPWRPKSNVRSFLTVLVYLPTAQPCVGGETVIDGEVVAADPGRVVVFPHDLRHEGRPVEAGQKLVLRNDVVGVSAPGTSVEEWRKANLSPAQMAAVAHTAGWRDIDVLKLLCSEYEEIGLGDAQSILLRLRGKQYRSAHESAMTDFAYATTLPPGMTEDEFIEFEERTQLGKRLRQLSKEGRHDEVDALLNELETGRLFDD